MAAGAHYAFPWNGPVSRSMPLVLFATAYAPCGEGSNRFEPPPYLACLYIQKPYIGRARKNSSFTGPKNRFSLVGLPARAKNERSCLCDIFWRFLNGEDILIFPKITHRRLGDANFSRLTPLPFASRSPLMQRRIARSVFPILTLA